jgi:hypothetical protein
MRNVLTKLAAALSPEMYRVAVDASNKELSAEIMKMALSLIVDEMGKELQSLGYTEEQVMAVIHRGSDRASMAGDIMLMQMAQLNPSINVDDLLSHD